MTLPKDKLQAQIIPGFRYMSREQMLSLYEELSLSMTTGEWFLLQSLYRGEFRDPSYEEIDLVDRLLLRRSRLPGCYVIPEAFFEDDAVSEVWDDLVSRRHRLRPDDKTPIRANEVLQVLTDDLFRAGKETVSDEGITVFADSSDSPVPDGGDNAAFLRDGENGFLFTATRGAKRWGESRNGDRLLMLFPGNISVNDSFLTDPDVDRDVLTCVPIGQEGLVATLLRRFDGVRMSLDFLTGGHGRANLGDLTRVGDGWCLLTVRPDRVVSLLNGAAARGVRLASIGEAVADSKLTLIGKERTPLSIGMATLRRLMLTFPTTPYVRSKDGIGLRLVTTPLTPVGTRPLTYQSATVRVWGNGYVAGAEAALYLLLDLCAAGADPGKLLVSRAVSVPDTSSDTSGDVLATDLGIYRILAELAVPAVNGAVLPGDGYRCSLAGIGPAIRHASPAQPSPVLRTLLLLPSGENGFPDFETVRRVQDRVAYGYKSGRILSGSAVHRTSLSALTKKVGDASTTVGFGLLLSMTSPLTGIPQNVTAIDLPDEG